MTSYVKQQKLWLLVVFAVVLLSACLMLDHIDQHEVSSRIRSAIDEVIRVGQALTVDMGGGASTTEYTDALVQALV